ncbi:hypothetical protein ACOME3_008561 [Neoechinorhynchus agilis]
MRIFSCNFCSGPMYPGHGITFVRNDCRTFRFCRAKCHRLFKKNKNPCKIKWTKAYRKANGKELSQDKVFEFERQRAEPMKYSRAHWQKAMGALKRIHEIQLKRQNRHLKKRLLKGTKDRMKSDLREIERHLNLLQHPDATKIDSEVVYALGSKKLNFEKGAGRLFSHRLNEMRALRKIDEEDDGFEVYEKNINEPEEIDNLPDFEKEDVEMECEMN